ncbi:MAG: alpha/beta hydrolase-fold protein [Pseudomonadota bacterium]
MSCTELPRFSRAPFPFGTACRMVRQTARVSVAALLVLLGPAWCQPFDAWLEAFESAADADAAVRSRLEIEPATPLRAGDQVLFLATSRRGRAPQIVGDFNDNGYAESDFPANGSMTRIGDSDWFALEAELPEDVRLEYQLRWGDEVAVDPLNPLRASTFGSERSVVVGSAARRAPARASGVGHSRLDRFSLPRSDGTGDHTVAVYVPSTNDPGGAPLPTLYVKDGSRFIDEIALPSILDALISDHRIRPAIVVFVDPRRRAVDYGTSASYRRWMVETLVPTVEQRYATGGSPERRGLLGASRGGLAVLDLALHHPELFAFCATMSPALSPLPIISRIETEDHLSGRFLVLVSRYDSPALVSDGRALVAALGVRSEGLIAREIPIDHSPLGWKAWADFVLLHWPAVAPQASSSARMLLAPARAVAVAAPGPPPRNLPSAARFARPLTLLPAAPERQNGSQVMGDGL